MKNVKLFPPLVFLLILSLLFACKKKQAEVVPEEEVFIKEEFIGKWLLVGTGYGKNEMRDYKGKNVILELKADGNSLKYELPDKILFKAKFKADTLLEFYNQHYLPSRIDQFLNYTYEFYEDKMFLRYSDHDAHHDVSCFLYQKKTD